MSHLIYNSTDTFTLQLIRIVDVELHPDLVSSKMNRSIEFMCSVTFFYSYAIRFEANRVASPRFLSIYASLSSVTFMVVCPAKIVIPLAVSS